MQAIVNVNENWGIGRNGDLLVYIPEDMRFFRETTAGRTVIMGRKTLESFPGGRPLKNRTNIVLTRDASRILVSGEEDRKLAVLEDLYALADYIREIPSLDVFVIGGESIYRQLLPYCERCLVTKNDCTKEPDSWFPDLDAMDNWHCTEESELREFEGTRFRFTVYENSCPLPLPEKTS